MKKLIALVLLFATSVFAADIKYEPTGDFVNDFAHILTPEQENSLRIKLAKFHTDTGNNFVFISTPSLDGNTIEDWSISLAEKWKVGKKGQDNGLLYIVAPKEHKSRVEVGYGLEGKLPDGKTAIINHQSNPFYKAGQFSVGINLVMDGLIAAATDTPIKAEAAIVQTPSNTTKVVLFHVLIFCLIVFPFIGYFVYLLCKNNRSINSSYSNYPQSDFPSSTDYSPPPYIPYSRPSSYSSDSSDSDSSPSKRSSSSSDDSISSSSSSSFDFGSSSSDMGGGFGGGGSSDSW